MLPGKNRLKKKRDFECVFKQGRGLKEGFLSLRFAKNGLKETRFGFVVGQKVSRKAVVRNKAKRILRELVRVKLGDIKNGFDVIVIAGKEAGAGSLKEIAAVFYRLLKAGKLFND